MGTILNKLKGVLLLLFACSLSLPAFSQSIQAEYFSMLSQNTVYDPNVVTFLNNVASAGYTAPTSVKDAVNTFVVGLKNNNLYPKIYDMLLCLGTTSATQAVLFKQASTAGVSFTAGVTFSFNGFITNGVSDYVNTLIVPATKLTLNNTHMALYSRTSAAGSSSSYDMGVLNSVSQEMSLIIRRSNNGNFSMAYNETGGMLNSTSATDGSGLFISNRPSATEHELFRNGTILLSQTTSGGSLPSGLNLVIGGVNNNGTVQGFTNRQYCFWSVGQGFTPAEAQIFTTLVNNLEFSLNRNTF